MSKASSNEKSDGRQGRVLVTGGAGYIGSHTCVELLQAGYEVVVYDSLVNSSRKSLDAVTSVSGRKPEFVEGDLRDETALAALFERYAFDSVIHFAGLKAVGESVEQPLRYYENNVLGTICLLRAMTTANLKTIVFSSSATVYGLPDDDKIEETAPTSAINPYGQSKLSIEHILQDIYQSDKEWQISILRYFNPVGAHVSGEMGEDPNGIPNNLLPFVSQVAVGRLPTLSVFGDDYTTPDGTGVRDYIHVVDLARGHLKALAYLSQHGGLGIHNLGTGQGHSVLEVVQAFGEAAERKIPYKIVPRRAGDAAQCVANPTKANKELNWAAEYDLKRMCEDAWRWQSSHPDGFDS